MQKGTTVHQEKVNMHETKQYSAEELNLITKTITWQEIMMHLKTSYKNAHSHMPNCDENHMTIKLPNINSESDKYEEVCDNNKNDNLT